jgi:drug/metabolite transporter (DMT)-like permease
MKIAAWLILALIWGTTWIFIKFGLEDIPPITFASTRFILSVVILLPIIFWRRIPLPKSAADWKLIALTGFLQFSLNYSAVFWSEQHITSGLAAVLQATITVFGLVLAWIFLPAERMTAKKIIGVALGVVGVAVIFIDQLRIESTMAFYGCVAIVAGAYCAAQASILVKAKGGGLDPAVLVCAQMLCGLPAIVAYALIAEGDPFALNWSWTAIASVFYLTIFGTVAAFWLYYWLLSRIESTKAMMISLVTPLLAVVIGAVTIGETLPPQTLFGGSLIIASIGMIVLRRRTFATELREKPETAS